MKNFLFYTLVFAIALTIGWAFTETRETITENIREKEAPEWCLIQTMESAGGKIFNPNAGSHTYQIIATKGGYEVYQRCNEL